MSNKTKLQQILDYLVNEEHEKAEELLHEYVVERAANIYETIVAEEDSDGVDDLESDIEESIGGDAKEDFVAEIEADKDDIESDELEDGEPELPEVGDEEGGDEGEGEVDFELDGGEGDIDGEAEEGDIEGKIDDLSAQMADLMAEFQSFLGDEEGLAPEAPVSDEELMAGMMYSEGEEVSEEDEVSEELEEATKLQDVVADPGMEQEGKLAGTGKGSKNGKTDKDSMFTKAPSKPLNGADPVDVTKGGEESGSKADKGKDHTPTDNINVEPKQEGSNEIIDQQKKEGELAGTGKGSQKGALNTDSPLTDAPKKP